MSAPVAEEPAARPAPVPFHVACAYWLRLGFISFGGPAGQIGLMHQELVEKRRWISEHRFLHALNYTMVLPGPEAQQLATYIGWLMHGVRGGIVAGVFFVLPSLLILIGLSWIYLTLGDAPLVAGMLYGIKPAVTAIVAFAAWRIGRRTLGNSVLRLIAVAAFLAIFAFDVPFPWIVFAAGLAGLLGARLAPGRFRMESHAVTGQGGRSTAPALIDDDCAVPEHARFRWSRLLSLVAIGLGMWAGGMAFLMTCYGWHGTLTQMGWFFTKAALVTFGGAYAVLPYVYQGGVEQYGWLTAGQMIDGLALGETTPGPLIMVVAFVGFVGGWTREIFGPELLPWAGVAGACVATLFTFLPSFLFILVGGPAVEASRHEIAFTAPLTGVTAAVVGVIVNLALFFAWHVMWPQGLDGGFDMFAATLCVAAFLVLARFPVGVVTVIAACAAAGMLRYMIL